MLNTESRITTLLRPWKLLAGLLFLVGLKFSMDAAAPDLISPKLTLWADNGISVLGTVLFLWIIRRAAIVGIEWIAERNSSSAVLTQGFIPMFRNLITLFIVFTGLIMILKQFNYDVMSLITALGVGSLAVGLAAKDTLSNMISGFTLVIDRNLRPGDRVNLGGTLGQVEDIGLRSTRIKTSDGNALIVPNSELVNTRILNLSQPTSGMNLTVGFKLPLSASFARIKPVCTQVLDSLELADRRHERSVHLAGLGDLFQTIELSFWIADVDQRTAAVSECNERLMAALEKDGFRLTPAGLLPTS